MVPRNVSGNAACNRSALKRAVNEQWATTFEEFGQSYEAAIRNVREPCGPEFRERFGGRHSVSSPILDCATVQPPRERFGGVGVKALNYRSVRLSRPKEHRRRDRGVASVILAPDYGECQAAVTAPNRRRKEFGRRDVASAISDAEPRTGVAPIHARKGKS